MATPSHRQRLIDPQNSNMQQQPNISMNAFNYVEQDRQRGPSLNQPSLSGFRQPLSAMSSNINNIQGGNRSSFTSRKGTGMDINKAVSGAHRNGVGFGNNGYDGNISSQSITLD